MSNGTARARASISIIFDEILLMFGFQRFLSINACYSTIILLFLPFLILPFSHFICAILSLSRKNITQICCLSRTSIDSCHSTSYTLQIIDISCASMLFCRRTLRFSHSSCWHRVRAKFVSYEFRSRITHTRIVSLSVSKCVSYAATQHYDYFILVLALSFSLSGVKSRGRKIRNMP